jgi:Flp pilus assembly pilin Flp
VKISIAQRILQERGQSAVEYIVVCAALAFALGIGMSDNNSVLGQLIAAFRLAYTRIAFAFSLP